MRMAGRPYWSSRIAPTKTTSAGRYDPTRAAPGATRPEQAGAIGRRARQAGGDAHPTAPSAIVRSMDATSSIVPASSRLAPPARSASRTAVTSSK